MGDGESCRALCKTDVAPLQLNRDPGECRSLLLAALSAGVTYHPVLSRSYLKLGADLRASLIVFIVSCCPSSSPS